MTAPGLWSAIPIGTIPQRDRAAAAPPSPVTGRPPVPLPPAPPEPSTPTVAAASSRPDALDAPTVALDPDPTNRLSARLLATRVAAPAQPPPRFPLPPVPAPSPWRPAPMPAPAPTPAGRDRVLPGAAALALLAVAVVVLVPWPGPGPWAATSPVGLALLVGAALLMAPVVVDLVTGRGRASAMLLGLPAMAAAAAGTVVVSGGDLPGVLAAQGFDVLQDRAALAVALALAVCLVVGVVGAVQRSPSPRTAAGASALVVGLCAALSTAAVSATVLVLGAPAPETAKVTTVAGAAPNASASAPAVTGTSCPAEASSTLPEAAGGALVVARNARVHIAICEGASGQAYYYGADDRTDLTITLPATQSGDGWSATNNGVTYLVTGQSLVITKGARTLADETLTTGWTR